MVDLIGRKSNKSPEKIVEKLIRRWIGRWKNLKFVKADKEFVTQETSELCESLGVSLRQAVPGEHRRGTREADGAAGPRTVKYESCLKDCEIGRNQGV